jgi:hypothetical protein
MKRIKSTTRKRNGRPSCGGHETNAVAPPGSHAVDDTGAVLVLALLFLVVIGLIVGGLASWTANSLTNSLHFQTDRSAQYALSSTSQVAIQNIRYTPLLGSNQTLNASPPSYCWGPTPAPGTGTVSELTVLNDQVAVWCSTVWTPTSSSTRVVTVSACLTSVVPTPPSGSSLASVQAAATQCAASPGLQTNVTFDDYSAANPTVNPGVCISPPNGTCGQGMTINSSTTGTVNPAVTSLSATVGPLTGGTALTVNGTGFVMGSGLTTVNFIATNLSANIVFPGVNVTVSSPTSLSVTTPPATTVTSYYVIVSTTNGSSQAGSQSQFTYQPVVPTVTSVATATNATCNNVQPPCGSAAGGTSITISGTGFLSPVAGDNTKVNFVDTANNAVVVQASYLSVNGYTNGVQTITATTPGIVQDSTYYVTVTTFPAGGTSATGPVFTYTPLDPVVASVNPTSGGSGTSITVTGIGFVSGGTTVQLVPTGNGSTLNATNVTVSASTTLTATVPSGGQNNATYYVEITTTTGGASCPNSGCGSGGAAPLYTY